MRFQQEGVADEEEAVRVRIGLLVIYMMHELEAEGYLPTAYGAPEVWRTV